jgi:hypothetical protein
VKEKEMKEGSNCGKLSLVLAWFLLVSWFLNWFPWFLTLFLGSGLSFLGSCLTSFAWLFSYHFRSNFLTKDFCYFSQNFLNFSFFSFFIVNFLMFFAKTGIFDVFSIFARFWWHFGFSWVFGHFYYH